MLGRFFSPRRKGVGFVRVARGVVVGQTRSVAQGRRMRSVGRTHLLSQNIH